MSYKTSLIVSPCQYCHDIVFACEGDLQKDRGTGLTVVSSGWVGGGASRRLRFVFHLPRRCWWQPPSSWLSRDADALCLLQTLSVVIRPNGKSQNTKNSPRSGLRPFSPTNLLSYRIPSLCFSSQRTQWLVKSGSKIGNKREKLNLIKSNIRGSLVRSDWVK